MEVLTSVLTSVAIFALGVIAGVLVAIGLDLFRYYFYRPRLVIEGDRPEIAANYSIHSLVIRNVGRGVAQRTQGVISFQSINPTDIVQDSKLKYTRDLVEDVTKFGITSYEVDYLRAGRLREINNEPLCWAAVDSRSNIDIYPQTSQLLDVCRFVKIEGYQQIQIPSRLGWQALLTSLRSRNYKIEVTAIGIDAKPKSKKFTIQYEGDDINLVEGWLE